MIRKFCFSSLVLALALILSATPATAQRDFSNVQIEAIAVRDGLWMLTGSGGNIGVSMGADGAFLIDDQYAPLTDKIRAAVKKLGDQPIRFVLNTHWHGDHTGGNENLGKAGTLIVAHDNVRVRMSSEQFLAAFNSRVPPAPEKALPVVTFNDTATFHLNGHEIHAFHTGPAHTDGDSVIHFRNVDAVHMGDCFFNGIYPFIDASTGGSIDGMIATADKVLAMTTDSTKIIPGHGPLATRADLQAFRDMLAGVRDAVAKLVAEGKSRDEVVAAKPTAAFDDKWGGGFLPPDVFAGIAFDSYRSKP